MKIEYITNASFFFTFSDGVTILTDPWYQDGIYHGLLFNYPPIEKSQLKKYQGLTPDYIYISHIHADHFDPYTLANYSHKTPILIGKFPNPALRLALSQQGFSNVIEYEFDQLNPLGKHEICVFGEFSSSSDDLKNDTHIPVDSSLYLKDANGHDVFFAVDNPMQERNAEYINDRFKDLDCAILSYSGASIYPFVFKNYSTEEKNVRVKNLRDSRVKKFCQIAKIINAKKNIPAAGSMVIGGVGAHYSAYLHQATPKQIETIWLNNKLPKDKLNLLATGDTFDLATNKTQHSPLAIGRHFTENDRINYANSIASFPCNLDDISWPENLNLPWRSFIFKARAKMWEQQKLLAAYPEIYVYFIIKSSDKLTFKNIDRLIVKISMTDYKVEFPDELPSADVVKRIEFYMNNQLMLALLLNSTYWNVAEYHMEIARYPDNFDPTLRSLLSFFKL